MMRARRILSLITFLTLCSPLAHAAAIRSYAYVSASSTTSGTVANFYDGNPATDWQGNFVATVSFIPDRLYDVTSFSYIDSSTTQMLTQVALGSAIANDTRYADTSTPPNPMTQTYAGRIGMWRFYSPSEGIVSGVNPGGAEFYLNGTEVHDPLGRPYLRIADPTIMGSSTPALSGWSTANIFDHYVGYGAGQYVGQTQNSNFNIDFDFGNTRPVEFVEVWQRIQLQITDFQLIFSNNPDFSSPVATTNVTGFGASMARIVDVTGQGAGGNSIQARYVRLQTTAGTGDLGLMEMAFYAAVPEPSTVCLLALGGLLLLRRRVG